MEFLKHAHSGLRWVALILLVVAIFNALSSKGKGKYEKKDKMLNLFAMIVLHIQLLIGLVLYFISPNVKFIEGWMKVKQLRFYGMEHLLIMVIAIAVVTIGRKKAENASNIAKKHGTIVKWFTIGLILILAGIPWPFRNLGGGWF
jgi:heme A synthase